MDHSLWIPLAQASQLWNPYCTIWPHNHFDRHIAVFLLGPTWLCPRALGLIVTFIVNVGPITSVFKASANILISFALDVIKSKKLRAICNFGVEVKALRH